MCHFFPNLRQKCVGRTVAAGWIWCLAGGMEGAPLKIMPMGDSITAGYTNNSAWTVPFEFGYRSGLYTRLKNAGVDFQFVGASPEPFDNKYGDPTLAGTVYPTLELRDPGINQSGHRGYGGISISTMNTSAAAYIAADGPDVILLMIGINGIGPSSPADLNTLVTTIFNAKATVRLVVAQIIPKIPYNSDVVSYNTYIRQTLVPTFTAQGKNISTVDQYVNFLTNPADNTSIDTTKYSNGINHPTNPAYELMAATWLPALTSIALDTSGIPANIAAQGVVANLSRLAPNPVEAFTFSLIAGSGGGDNSFFQIQNGQLRAGKHHFEVDPPGKNYSIRVRATGNSSHATVDQALILSLVPGTVAPPAALIQTFSNSVQSTYAGDVKNTDLLQGLTGTHLNYKPLSGTGYGPRINDGLHGLDTNTAGIAWATDGNITSSTFALGAGNGGGYDISKITSIAAWNGAGFMNQKYKVSVRYSGATRFTAFPDCSVNFQPFSNSLTEAGATKVILTRPGGLLFSGIEEIRFTILDTVSSDIGGTTFREIDVEGTKSAVSLSRILEVDTGSLAIGNVTVTWQSRPGFTYRVESSANLQTWAVLSAAFASGGYSTSYTDTPAPGGRTFYRLLAN